MVSTEYSRSEPVSIVKTLLSGVIASSTDGSAVDVAGYRSAEILVDVTAVSGTDPTLIIEIETSKNGTDWWHMGTVIDETREGDLTRLTAPTDEAKITTTGKYKKFIDVNMGNYIRATATLGGTDPSFTLTAVAVLKS